MIYDFNCGTNRTGTKPPDGLVPAVVQDADTKDVLMLGFMNRAALEKTLREGKVTFWTRSRQKLWTKGETSGNTLNFVSLRINCNDDSLLVLARPIGATCHTGHPTCYYREVAGRERGVADDHGAAVRPGTSLRRESVDSANTDSSIRTRH